MPNNLKDILESKKKITILNKAPFQYQRLTKLRDLWVNGKSGNNEKILKEYIVKKYYY